MLLILIYTPVCIQKLDGINNKLSKLSSKLFYFFFEQEGVKIFLIFPPMELDKYNQGYSMVLAE